MTGCSALVALWEMQIPNHKEVLHGTHWNGYTEKIDNDKCQSEWEKKWNRYTFLVQK